MHHNRAHSSHFHLMLRMKIFFVLIFLSVAAHASADLDLQEGNWETVVTIQADGKTLPLPAIRSNKCITRQDPLPNATQDTDRCRIFEEGVRGNEVSWKVRCEDQKGVMEGRGTVNYAGRTFQGSMSVSVREAENKRSMDMTYVLNGRHTGKCK